MKIIQYWVGYWKTTHFTSECPIEFHDLKIIFILKSSFFHEIIDVECEIQTSLLNASTCHWSNEKM